MICVDAVGVCCVPLELLLPSILTLVWVFLLLMTSVGLVMDFAVGGGGIVEDGCFQVGLVLSILVMGDFYFCWVLMLILMMALSSWPGCYCY